MFLLNEALHMTCFSPFLKIIYPLFQHFPGKKFNVAESWFNIF